MKRKLLFPVLILLNVLGVHAQVTQINSNRSLRSSYPLSSTKSFCYSQTDSSIWVTDGTLAGTIPLSATIKYVGELGSLVFLNGNLIFAGYTPATGTEIYMTDGTPAGTVLVSDINPGPASSNPDDDDAALLNGFIYFLADRPAEGRELWRTDGTAAGTTLVKDIVPGVEGSNNPGSYELFSSGTYLLFAAATPASGIELWKSDGTAAGTVLFKDINTGHAGADSSNPSNFNRLNNVVLFIATDATNGEETWRTDGTATGTFLLKDINPGAGSSTKIETIPGYFSSILPSFHVFNNHAYFTAFDGTSSGELWSTDGTTANTILLKNIVPASTYAFTLLELSINLPNKFIFAVADGAGRSELWQSDGTSAGTVLFKSFVPTSLAMLPPLLYVPFDVYNFNLTSGEFPLSLFQGNKFFFSAGTTAEGNELWISDGVDGTAAHTHIVKDIIPGTQGGIDTTGYSYVYTSSGIYFPATTPANGLELWRSDGTDANTTMVADIVPGAGGSQPVVNFFLVNNKILFVADNGDNEDETDLYAVEGNFSPLPVLLTNFTVLPKSDDAILNWQTTQELNSKNFTVQRSFDGVSFPGIGTIAAVGSSSVGHSYSFTDAGIMKSGKSIVYYRLLTNDQNGKSAVSPVIALRIKNTGKWSIRLLSNPVVSDNINVVLSGITENVQLSVVDMSGKKLYSSRRPVVNGLINLPIPGLPRGNYTLLTESGNEKVAVQFVK